jgi:hypothetical protein
MERWQLFGEYTKNAKTPGDLCKAIQELGPLPHCHTFSEPLPPKMIHIRDSIAVNPKWLDMVEAVRQRRGQFKDKHGNVLGLDDQGVLLGRGVDFVHDETEPAAKDADLVYRHARQTAIRLRASRPGLPLLPPTETDPFLGFQTIQEWSVGAANHEKVTRRGQFPWKRVLSVVFLFVLLELCAGFAAWRWGEGENPLQKFISCSPLFGYAFGASVMAAAFLLGRQSWARIRTWWRRRMGEAE